jgi:hypothetical protein
MSIFRSKLPDLVNPPDHWQLQDSLQKTQQILRLSPQPTSGKNSELQGASCEAKGFSLSPVVISPGPGRQITHISYQWNGYQVKLAFRVDSAPVMFDVSGAR